MFLITDINQSAVTSPTVRMNDAVESDPAPNNGLQSVFLDIGNDLGIDTAIAFEDTEDDGFATGSATSFAFDSGGTEVRFIDFDLSPGKRRGSLAFLNDAESDFQEDLINRFMSQAGQLGDSIGGQIKSKELDDLTSFSLRNFSIPIISV